jgi:lipoate-protein ligase B
VERGGDVTVHAPGQLVGYPILDLSGHREDVHWYLRQIEEALICALASLGVDADRHPGYTGVWTDGRKIASIGIHVKRWVTLHGFALNVTTDLSAFDLVVPCGIPGVVMTSVELETGGRTHGRTEGRSGGRQEPLWNRARAETIRAFGDIFQREPVMTTLAEVDLMASARLD